jgi:hypothetical protein
MDDKIIYKELSVKQDPNVDTLFKIYAKDKFKARVFFMYENKLTFKKSRLVVFEGSNEDFSIVYFERRYGISKTNIIYNRESRIYTIIKKGNKFYFKDKNGIKPLILTHLYNIDESSKVKSELVSRLPWLRYLTEISVLQSVSLNTIYSKKLFSLDKALRYEYKLPLPSAKLLFSMEKDNQMSRYLKYYVDYLDNVENLHNTLPTYEYYLFYDAVKMAKTLNRKVNCSWSARRLKEEHDKWSEEILDIVFTEGDRLMNIADIFIRFSDASGFRLLRTTKEMNIEGKKNKHCVGTYVNNVESGNSGIYSIGDYTLELKPIWSKDYKNRLLMISQFRGYKNCNAPTVLYEQVNAELLKFNGTKNGYDIKDCEFDFEDLDTLFQF